MKTMESWEKIKKALVEIGGLKAEDLQKDPKINLYFFKKGTEFRATWSKNNYLTLQIIKTNLPYTDVDQFIKAFSRVMGAKPFCFRWHNDDNLIFEWSRFPKKRYSSLQSRGVAPQLLIPYQKLFFLECEEWLKIYREQLQSMSEAELLVLLGCCQSHPNLIKEIEKAIEAKRNK